MSSYLDISNYTRVTASINASIPLFILVVREAASDFSQIQHLFTVFLQLYHNNTNVTYQSFVFFDESASIDLLRLANCSNTTQIPFNTKLLNLIMRPKSNNPRRNELSWFVNNTKMRMERAITRARRIRPKLYRYIFGNNDTVGRLNKSHSLTPESDKNSRQKNLKTVFVDLTKGGSFANKVGTEANDARYDSAQQQKPNTSDSASVLLASS